MAGHKGQPKNVIKAGRPCSTTSPQRSPRQRYASHRKTTGAWVDSAWRLSAFATYAKRSTINHPPGYCYKMFAPKSLIYTDEYNIYHRLDQWGFEHKSVCHSAGEYARDEDQDGFCEVHVNTQEGIWSVLRSWLRPHRGVCQNRLPIYLGFFEFIFNTRRRGKALLGYLFQTILAPDLRSVEENLHLHLIVNMSETIIYM